MPDSLINHILCNNWTMDIGVVTNIFVSGCTVVLIAGFPLLSWINTMLVIQKKKIWSGIFNILGRKNKSLMASYHMVFIDAVSP